MSKVYRRLSLVMVMMLVVSMLAACGGGGDDDDNDDDDKPSVTATSSSGQEDDATPTTGDTASTPRPVAPTPTTEAASPTAEPTATTGASGEPVSVDALWFASDGQSVQGGTSQVVVSVESKEGQDLRVGFFESEVGGSGPQWRAAGWMAVITASLLIGNDPSNYEFSFDVAGRIDGPSAGALMTIAVLAGYLGDTVDDTVTMTGTINPDGTIGPVGGIPHKIEGAAAAGKTTVLVPGGQRYDYDYALGQSVDLVQVGSQYGVEVKLVSDIYEAYSALTGSELPAPASAGQASFPPTAFDKYRAGATNWYAVYQAEVSDFFALPVEVQEYRYSTIEVADYYASQANGFLAEGQIAAAYENAFTAAALARLGREAAELDNVYYQQGIGPLVDRLNSSSSAQTRMSAVAQRLEAENPRTAADSIAIMDSFSNLSVAQGLIFQADAALRDYANNPEATEDDALTAIYAANYNYVYADMFLDLAETGLGIGLGFGNAPAPNLEVLTAISETLRRGAEANITYFESLIIDPWAQQYGIHPDLAKYYFQQSDNSYLTAVAAVAGASSLAGTMMKEEARASVNLGSALTAYSQSASLIAKYYSLSAQIDEFGSVVGYDRQSTLVDMLDLADQRARQWLSSVAGEDPVQALYYYDNARLLRSGTPDEQLSALNYYWQSAILSETLAVFSTPSE